MTTNPALEEVEVMSPVPKDHPLMIAWEKYKQTSAYQNTRKWAAHEQHVDGSLWAAFSEGFNTRANPAPAQDAREVANEDWRKRGAEISSAIPNGRDAGRYEEEDALSRQPAQASAQPQGDDYWNKESIRLSGGLLHLHDAPENTPASVFKSLAYDIALNCITPDVVHSQIERRIKLAPPAPPSLSQPDLAKVREALEIANNDYNRAAFNLICNEGLQALGVNIPEQLRHEQRGLEAANKSKLMSEALALLPAQDGKDE